MKRLFASAVLLSVGFSIDIPLVESASAAKPGGPTKLGPPIPYYSGQKYLTGQRHLYAADLNGDGIDEVIYSGHIRNGSKFRSAVVDVNGKNVTKKYFRPNKTSAEITQIYDLNNDGKDDVIFWGGTDSDYHMPSYVYLSNKKGPHTRKMVTPKVWYHGAGQGDLDGDGKVDFVGTGYDGKGKYVVSYKKRKLLIRRLKYAGSKCCYDGLGVGLQQGSDIAIGNFDADDNIELIITDYLRWQDTMVVEVYKTNNKFIYVRDDLGIKLPTEYWETSKGKSKIRKLYKNVNRPGYLSHDIRLIPFDINNDQKMDLIRVSRPWETDGKKVPGISETPFWPHYGHLQMLISNGKGVFSDKTAKYLKRWNIKLSAPYDFKFVDINKDGLTDIFYTDADTWAKSLGTENATAANGFLINTGSGFKNYGNAWFKNQTKKAMNAARRKFHVAENWAPMTFALGNFDTDSDLEVASCAQGGNYVGSSRLKSKQKNYCAFWFSDITIKFPKYKAKKSGKLRNNSLTEDIHIIKEGSGKRIYTDQPWKYAE